MQLMCQNRNSHCKLELLVQLIVKEGFITTQSLSKRASRSVVIKTIQEHSGSITPDDGSVISDNLDPVKLSSIRPLVIHSHAEVSDVVHLVQHELEAVLQFVFSSVVVDLSLVQTIKVCNVDDATAGFTGASADLEVDLMTILTMILMIS